MFYQIEPAVINSQSRRTQLVNVKIPGKCPVCGTANQDPPRVSLITEIDETDHLFVTYYCQYCEHCYFAHYRVDESTCETISPFHLYPYRAHSTEFQNDIKELSHRFVEIYNQSETAEQNGLYEICGIGYRKSLEFLVKDFAIHRFPDDIENIRSMPLSACIDNYIDSIKIKTLAKASAWLGNDETHYVRKHEEYGVDTLKNFILGVANFISYELYFETAEEVLHKKS